MAKKFQQQTLDENELIKIRRDKLQAFVDKGVEPFGSRFEVTHHATDVRAQFGDIEGETDAGEVTIAGRLMAIRGHGKASFATLADRSGAIQVYFKLDVVGEEKYSEFKLLDIGDIIGVRGQVFKTQRGDVHQRIMCGQGVRFAHVGDFDFAQRSPADCLFQSFADMIRVQVNIQTAA